MEARTIMTQETILSRIKKLMNMTVERGATVEEAATAQAKAQALLFEHNLSMASVDAHSLDKTGEQYAKTAYELREGKDQSMDWRRTLLYIIAKANFCTAITHPDTPRLMSMIGKPSNIEIVTYLYEHVQREVHKLAKAAQRLQTSQKSTYYTAFCRGACATIKERLREQSTKSAAAGAACTALVVQSQADLDKAITRWFPYLVAGRRKTGGRSADGFAYGKAAGAGIGLNRGVGSSGAGQRRLS
jgi:hypothetical protein